MKIKHVKVEIGRGYTWLQIWLMIPDFYTFWEKLRENDRTYLKECWDKGLEEEIQKFMEGYRLSLCRGCIRIGARCEAPKKRFSWTWFRNRYYGIWTELNTPLPEKPRPDSPIKPLREVPISRTHHFLSLLRIPIIYTCMSPKDYITLYILRRDYDKNIQEGRICR